MSVIGRSAAAEPVPVTMWMSAVRALSQDAHNCYCGMAGMLTSGAMYMKEPVVPVRVYSSSGGASACIRVPGLSRLGSSPAVATHRGQVIDAEVMS